MTVLDLKVSMHGIGTRVITTKLITVGHNMDASSFQPDDPIIPGARRVMDRASIVKQVNFAILDEVRGQH